MNECLIENESNVVVAPNNIGATLHDSLLDSSLILTTNKVNYNLKIINCNNYVQVYCFENSKLKNNKDIEKINNFNQNIQKLDTDSLTKKGTNSNYNIEIKNIMRSKLECQRLAKCNAEDWKTFITLTFSENITEIKIANKKFRYFIDKVQRVFKELKYICIPEFQKRGAVHYHLLTNISINNDTLIYSQENNKKFKHIKYWNEGFTKVDTLDNDIKKIIGYISKYMTKDIDNRLFNRHRYFYSRNLKKPTISYLNLSNSRHLEFYNKLLNNKKIIYENNYLNSYNKQAEINFREYL